MASVNTNNGAAAAAGRRGRGRGQTHSGDHRNGARGRGGRGGHHMHNTDPSSSILSNGNTVGGGSGRDNRRGGGGGGSGGGGRGRGGNRPPRGGGSHNHNHHNHGGIHMNGNGNDEAASIALAMALSQQDGGMPAPAAAAAAASSSSVSSSVAAGPVVAGVKGNANHLLSFHFAPVAVPTGRPPVRRQRRAPVSSFNKETFVHANYHFVVSAGDHTASLSDPDTPVEWQHVQLVFFPVQTSVAPVCPICLDPPVAAKMTKCGHVFCFACILHYLELADDDFDRCPLCFEAVYLHSLKSLHFIRHKKFEPNENVEFVLVKRSRDSVIPYSRSDSKGMTASYTLQRAQFARITITRDISDIITRERAELYEALHNPGLEEGSKMWLQGAIDEVNERERKWCLTHGTPRPIDPPPSATTSSLLSSLNPKLIRSSSDPLSSKTSEASFPTLQRVTSPPATSTLSKKQPTKTLAALATPAPTPLPTGTSTTPTIIGAMTSPLSSTPANEKKVSSKALKLNPKATSWTPDAISTPIASTAGEEVKAIAKPSDAFLEPGEVDTSRGVTPSNNEEKTAPAVPSIAANEARRAKNDDDDSFYFYQSSDGQQLYLHNLNHRAFKAEYQTEEAFPQKISAKLLEVEKFTQSDITRRRYKFLAHLPLTSNFAIGLVDHTTICSADTNRKFASEMKEMSVARAKRLRQHKALNKRLDQRAAQAMEYHHGPTLANALANDVAAGQSSFPTLADNPFGFSLSGDATPSASSTTTSTDNANNGSVNDNADVPLAKRLSHWSSVAKRGMAGNDTWVALPPTTTTIATTTSSSSTTSGAPAKLSRQPSSGQSPASGPLPSPLAALAAAISKDVPVATVAAVASPPALPVVAMPAPVIVRQASGVDESRPDRVFAPLTRKSDTLFGGHSPASMTPVVSPVGIMMGSPSLGPAAVSSTHIPAASLAASSSTSSLSSVTRTPPMVPVPTGVTVPPVNISAWMTRSSPASPTLAPAASPVAAAGSDAASKKKGGKQKTQLITTGSQRAYR